MPIILGILWLQMITSLVHLHLKVPVLLKFFTHVPYMFLHSDSIPQQDCPIVNRMSFIILMGCLLINGVTERTIGSIYRDQLIYQHMYLLEVWRNLKPTQCRGNMKTPQRQHQKSGMIPGLWSCGTSSILVPLCHPLITKRPLMKWGPSLNGKSIPDMRSYSLKCSQ